ncbi:MAG: energy transducer TonB, partial [Paludibacteraceae bacterium]|nr:energy transducer TonB [Paludibacteraceae bacterium]
QLAEQRAKEQAAIAKANQLGALFGNNNAGAAGSGDTQGNSQRGNAEVGKGSSGGNSWALDGRRCKALPKPSNDFKQEGKVVVAIIVDGNGKVVSAKATEGTTISNDATIQLALKAAYKAEFSFTDRPDKQFGTITYIFKFN